MSEALWFLLGCSLMTNFFLLWKLAEANDAIDIMMDTPLEETKDKTDAS